MNFSILDFKQFFIEKSWHSFQGLAWVKVNLLEIIGNVVGRVFCGRRTVDLICDALVPLEAILLCNERVSEVKEHPSDADDAVDAFDSRGQQQGNADSLCTENNQTFSLVATFSKTWGKFGKIVKNLVNFEKSWKFFWKILKKIFVF